MTNLRDRELYNRELRRENQAIRENNNAASGLMLGIILTSLVGLGLGALFLFNQRTESPAPTNRQTIIERTQEVPVPVPQPQAPDVNINVPQPEAPPAPDVNLNIPNPIPQEAPTTNTAPSADTAPATTETAPAQGE